MKCYYLIKPHSKEFTERMRKDLENYNQYHRKEIEKFLPKMYSKKSDKMAGTPTLEVLNSLTILNRFDLIENEELGLVDLTMEFNDDLIRLVDLAINGNPLFAPFKKLIGSYKDRIIKENKKSVSFYGKILRFSNG